MAPLGRDNGFNSQGRGKRGLDGGKEVHGQKLGHGFRTNIHFDFAAWVPERQASWAVALYAVPFR